MNMGVNYLSLLPIDLTPAAIMLVEYSAAHRREVPDACAHAGAVT